MISISSAFPVLPAQDSLYYELLALTAICGEVPCACADRLTSSKSYRKKVVTSLTHDKLLRIFSKDHLRGYRLGIRGKRLLRERAPERFQFYLSGRTDTNSIKSSPARRLRLHRIAQTYVTMLNAGTMIYRDEKPPVFVPGGSSPCRIEAPVFYDSREMKELGLEMVKVHGSRMAGSLLTPSRTFAVFNGMDAVPVFDTQIEQRGKIMLQNIRYLRNKNLSLKAKGLLSQMLSLPDDWDYTLKGLAAINKESVDAIRTAIWELEDAGYVVRTRVRDERGCLRGCDYYVYEYPQTLSSGSGSSAESVPPMLEPLASDSAALGNPMQLNKEIQNKEKQNTDSILSEGESVRTKVRDNIELDLLCHNQPESAPVMQEIYELVVETIQLRSPVLRLGNNLFPMALVRERLLQLTSEHIRFVLDGLRNLRTDVKNLKKYLLTMLFNAPVTLNGRTMLDVRKSVNSGFRTMLA